MSGNVEMKPWRRVVAIATTVMPWIMLGWWVAFFAWHGLLVEAGVWRFVAIALALMIACRLLVRWVVKHDRVLWGRWPVDDVNGSG
jgi:hypothetical protein